MVQRSMIMNLYQDYCDGLFYLAFTECSGDVPTMSDEFSVLLEKLSQLQWDSATAIGNLQNPPQCFKNRDIDVIDQYIEGYNSSSQMYGPATSLRENGEVNLNFQEYTDYFDDKYRVRIATVKIRLLDKQNPPSIYESPSGVDIKFDINFPMEFRDKDAANNNYTFHGLDQHLCASDYKFNEEGEAEQITSCEVTEEFNSVNYKTSLDGQFNLKANGISQDILEDIGGIKVIFGGEFILMDSSNEKDMFECNDL